MTFNVENLFSRFAFNKRDQESYLAVADALDAPDRNDLVRAYHNILEDENRVATGLAVGAGNPDILCLQEVESLRVLDYFHGRFLRRMAREYDYRYLIEGNDPRGIDVAILSRYKIESVSSHRQQRIDNQRVWSRDCLEVDVKVHGKLLTVYVNHFKSMMGGRDATADRRRTQAQALVELIKDRFGGDPSGGAWVIAGDLNDYHQIDGSAVPSSLDELGIGSFCHDMLERQEPAERWTHYWAGGDECRQLDYILVSPAIHDATPSTALVDVIRQGLPHRAPFSGERFPRIGYDRPKASDHCPLMAELTF